jgi:hypothetical protein
MPRSGASCYGSPRKLRCSHMPMLTMNAPDATPECVYPHPWRLNFTG